MKYLVSILAALTAVLVVMPVSANTPTPIATVTLGSHATFTPPKPEATTSAVGMLDADVIATFQAAATKQGLTLAVSDQCGPAWALLAQEYSADTPDDQRRSLTRVSDSRLRYDASVGDPGVRTLTVNWVGKQSVTFTDGDGNRDELSHDHPCFVETEIAVRVIASTTRTAIPNDICNDGGAGNTAADEACSVPNANDAHLSVAPVTSAPQSSPSCRIVVTRRGYGAYGTTECMTDDQLENWGLDHLPECTDAHRVNGDARTPGRPAPSKCTEPAGWTPPY